MFFSGKQPKSKKRGGIEVLFDGGQMEEQVDGVAKLSEYEALRLRNIGRNDTFLLGLGIVGPTVHIVEKNVTRKRNPADAPPLPSRQSSRASIPTMTVNDESTTQKTVLVCGKCSMNWNSRLQFPHIAQRDLERHQGNGNCIDQSKQRNDPLSFQSFQMDPSRKR